MYRQSFISEIPRQYTAVDYFQAAEELSEKLSFFISNLKCQAVKQYNLSSYYENLELVVTGSQDYEDLLEQALPLLGANLITREQNRWSFLWRDLKVNIYNVNPKSFEFACHYYSYNHIGAMLGCVAEDKDYRIDAEGLWHIIDEREKSFADDESNYMLITRQFDMALEILGYSYTSFRCGFNSMCELLKFALNHPIINAPVSLNRATASNSIYTRQQGAANESIYSRTVI